MTMRTVTVLVLVSCLVQMAGSGLLQAAAPQLKAEAGAPPAELSQEVRALLQSNAIRVLDGDKPVMEFWLRTEVALTSVPSDPAKSLDALKQPALFGAVRIPSASRDYRDDELPAGVYTMRFGLQPSDGNHLGSSDYIYFAVLVPAKYDTKPDAIADYKAMTKASSKDTSTDHPLILSLRPISGPTGPTPSLQEPVPDHRCVRLRLAGRSGETKAEVVFDLVYAGKANK